MVSASYLAEQPAGPSASARAFHQRVLPTAIEAAAQLEAILERTAQAGRRRPFTALEIAFGIGLLVSALRPRH
jgi:hypothetical protein